MLERIREIIAEFMVSPLSPEEYQKRLEKKAEEVEERAAWVEKEAETRKKIAKARLRIRKAEGEMGRSYGRVLKFVVVIGVVILVLFFIVQGC